MNHEPLVDAICESYLKKKTVMLYKLYTMKNGEEMHIDTSFDIYGLTMEGELRRFLEKEYLPNQEEAKRFTEHELAMNLPCQMVTIKFPVDEFKNKPLVVGGTGICTEDTVTASISNKGFTKMDIIHLTITSVEYIFDVNNEMFMVKGAMMVTIDDAGNQSEPIKYTWF